ncbi:ATP synthase F1 subunit delta [Patescibacteria group bacterium]|nr:ATP synthase F1 subunit delta [Patescibacteria group bacterium]MBU0963918.1 ATP synthase F1 subunit delta [Patescibacteria group bacterium]
MKKITPKKYAVSLYEILQEVQDDKVPEVLGNFVKLLVWNKDLSQADKIINVFGKYANEQENILELIITSAKKLDQDVKNNIVKQLASSLNKKIEINELVDPGLIGGAKLQYGDTIIDGSIKRRLELLGESLKK